MMWMGSLCCMCACVYPKCAAGWYFTQSCDAVQIVCWHCLVLLLCKAEGRKREPSKLHLPVHQHFSEPIHFTSDQTNHQTNYSVSGPPNTFRHITNMAFVHGAMILCCFGHVLWLYHVHTMIYDFRNSPVP